MSFMGFMSSPVSIPPVMDTTPCLDHLMEYEDCVIDVGTNKKEFFMPAWPTLYPQLHNGDVNFKLDNRYKEVMFKEGYQKDNLAQHEPLTQR